MLHFYQQILSLPLLPAFFYCVVLLPASFIAIKHNTLTNCQYLKTMRLNKPPAKATAWLKPACIFDFQFFLHFKCKTK